MKLTSQPGAQSNFLSCPADIVLFGGAAGAGKTHALFLEFARRANRKNFTGVVFRRSSSEFRGPGGLWDTAVNFFGEFNPKPVFNHMKMRITFPHSGACLQFCGVYLENQIRNLYGSELDFAAIDECQFFMEGAFDIILSRLRSVKGHTKPYLRLTCNPPDPANNAGSFPEYQWPKKLVEWYLQDSGRPDKSKSGIIRYYIKLNNEKYWFDTAEEGREFAFKQVGRKINPISFSYIPGTIEDNKILMERSPQYRDFLEGLDDIAKERLLHGNWNAVNKGEVFSLDWFRDYDIAPEMEMKIIIVDTAQEVKEKNDYTVIQCWGLSDKGIYLLAQVRDKLELHESVEMCGSMFLQWKPLYICVERKANGSALMQELRRNYKAPIHAIERNAVAAGALKGFNAKYRRAFEARSYVQNGYVFLKKSAAYYPELAEELTSFKYDGKLVIHDDQVDCLCDAVKILIIDKIFSIKKEESTINHYHKPPISFAGSTL